MWILIIALTYTSNGITSEQIPFETQQACEAAAQKLATQEGWQGYDSGFLVSTICVERDH